MTRTIIRERLPYHPLLGRHVHHDSESRRYAFDTTGLSVVSAKHQRRIPVLDQGQLGSCTGNAGIGCLGTDPYYDTVRNKVAQLGPTSGGYATLITGVSHYTFDEAGAVALYSDATAADDYPGQYPPTDTGSDGLTIAKVLKSHGQISGYTHTFSLDDALKAVSVTPVITGVNWYDGMFDVDSDGRVRPTGGLAGGHEFVVDECDANNGRVWFTNSWGTGWGLSGRAYLTWDDWGTLLGQQGDVTIFTPLTQPAPTPTPPEPVPGPTVDAYDRVLALVAHRWVKWRHTPIAGNSEMSAAVKVWLQAKSL